MPKYRDSENPFLTWSGRGCRPKWLEAKLRAGASLEDFRIVATEESQEGSEEALAEPFTSRTTE